MKHSIEYDRYMHSKAWERKRQERIEIDNHVCCMCGRPEGKCKNGLQVHHISYQHLGNEIVETELCSLCPTCHRLIHKYYSRAREKPRLFDQSSQL